MPCGLLGEAGWSRSVWWQARQRQPRAASLPDYPATAGSKGGLARPTDRCHFLAVPVRRRSIVDVHVGPWRQTGAPTTTIDGSASQARGGANCRCAPCCLRLQVSEPRAVQNASSAACSLDGLGRIALIVCKNRSRHCPGNRGSCPRADRTSAHPRQMNRPGIPGGSNS